MHTLACSVSPLVFQATVNETHVYPELLPSAYLLVISLTLVKQTVDQCQRNLAVEIYQEPYCFGF